MKININRKAYTLDEKRAIELGVLKEVPKKPVYPLKPGDVYYDPTGACNPFLLVEVIYGNANNANNARFQLLGLGCSVNSNSFFNSIHTSTEVAKYLTENRMSFRKNIQAESYGLVR